MSQHVNWVLDADIRSFYDSIDHEWLMRMVAHRIADPRVLRLIRMWLEAGILESGEWHETDKGTPQGAGISPLLANIVLHYALDLWVHQWRRRHAGGRVSIVRYADDFVMGFERAADAQQMMVDLKAHLARSSLALHEDKTRLIECGRLPAMARRQRGARRPDTFAFLGFTHYCGWIREGKFIVKHKTRSKRLTRKLKALRQEAQRIMHVALVAQDRWYISVLLGDYGYFGVPHKLVALVKDPMSGLPDAAREILELLIDQLSALNVRVASLDREFERRAKDDQVARRLMTIPGIGAITATALAALAPPIETFRRGRDFAAWLGLTPLQHSTGRKERLRRTSRMGERTLRRLLIIGASAVASWAARKGAPAGSWLARMLRRKATPMNKCVISVVCALAAR